MRRAAIGIGLLALLATACGANTQVANAGNTASPTTSVSTTPPTSAPPTTTSAAPNIALPTPTPPKVSTGPAVPPAQVDYSQLPDQYPHSLWTQDDGRTVVVMGEEGGCAKLSGTVTEQTATEVHISLLTVVESHRMCPLYVRNIPVAVTLNAPLGSRKVVLTSTH